MILFGTSGDWLRDTVLAIVGCQGVVPGENPWAQAFVEVIGKPVYVKVSG